MLGRLVVPKIIYVRPVGSPENTSNIGENPNMNNLTWPPRPSPWQPRGIFLSKTFRGGEVGAYKVQAYPKVWGRLAGTSPKTFSPSKNSSKREIRSSQFFRDLSQFVRRTPRDTPVPQNTRTSPWPKLIYGTFSALTYEQENTCILGAVGRQLPLANPEMCFLRPRWWGETFWPLGIRAQGSGMSEIRTEKFTFMFLCPW